MDKVDITSLIKRTLGLKHKLKVHESLKPPETHEDLSVMILSKWELEDELSAIDEILTEKRTLSVAEKKKIIKAAIAGKTKTKKKKTAKKSK